MDKNIDAARHSIYLASRSPRRAEILQQLGVNFTVLPSDIDESQLEHERPEDYVLRLAAHKATACTDLLATSGMTERPILAADTTVSIDGLILGKPVNDDEARAMLRRMAGRSHAVYTGLALATRGGIATALSTTRVHMAALSDQAIDAYIATGEPRDKAGAYGIQGLAGVFIERIEGSYTGVMGLPIFETAALLGKAGICILATSEKSEVASNAKC